MVETSVVLVNMTVHYYNSILVRMSVGKMGSKTRAGPGILKLKTGFSDTTSKILVHFN